jgi:hypothetical protein
MATASFAKPSFAKNPGDGSSAPVEVEVLDKSNPAHPAAQSQAPAVQQPAAVGFYTGDEEGGGVDAADVKLPRLNMIQGLSGAELKALGKEGDWVLKGKLLLPKPVSIVAVGHRPKVWIEKVKQGDKARFARSLQEVQDLGGTDEWRLSKYNEKVESKKGWFMESATWLLLVKRPDGAEEDYFPFVSDDGIAFAAALYTTKSTSYGAFHKEIASEKASGLLRQGYPTRYIELGSEKGLKHQAFEPRVKVGAVTSEGVRALAKKAIATLTS